MAAHEKFLTIFLFLLALVPIILTLIMLFVLGYAYFVSSTRRDNIKLTLSIKNKDVFESYGVKLSPSEDYEWIVAEIVSRKPGMVQKSLKIGAPKKDSTGGTVPAQDTSQGLLGQMGNVDLD